MDWVKIFNLAPGKELYEILKNSTFEEREILCREQEYTEICKIIDVDTRSKLTGPVFLKHGKGTFMQYLEAMNDFDTAYDLIKAVRPAFVYTKEFKQFVDKNIVYSFIEEDNPRDNTHNFQLGSHMVVMFHGDLQNPSSIMTLYDEYSYDYGDESSMKFIKNGIIVHELWSNRQNNLPSSIYYYNNGDIKEERWMKQRRTHRDNDLPADIKYYKKIDGVSHIKSKTWYKNDEIHRENGPALEEFYEDGKLKLQEWFLNDTRYEKIKYDN